MGVFGPLETANRTVPIIAPPQEAPINNEDSEIARKHQLEEESNLNLNGPPGKKPRLTNGYEIVMSNGVSNGNGNGSVNGAGNYYESASTPMEIDGDQNGDGHAYPSPEQLPSPIIATNGPEKGTQLDKVSNLRTETIYLDLLDDNLSKSTVLRCEWNPKLPNILTAGGTDALARMWDLSHTVSNQTNGTNTNHDDSGMNGNGVFPPCTQLLEPLSPQTTMVNELTWSSDGAYILVGSEQIEGIATLAVWSVKGQLLHTSAPMESPIISVKWNPSNSLFLSISPFSQRGYTQNQATIVTITSIVDFRTIQLIRDSDLIQYPQEAEWLSDDEFIMCGADNLDVYRIVDGNIINVRKLETRDDHRLSKIAFDRVSKLLATGSEHGMIDVSIFILNFVHY